MAKLVLQPTFDDKTRAEIEAHIAEVRARRMQAAVEHAIGVNLKLEHEANVYQRRIAQQLEMLSKELVQMDKLDARIAKRLENIEILYQELGLTEAMLLEAAAAANVET